MAIFKYKAKDGPKNVDGTVDAQSREEAIEKINDMGYLPVRIEAATDSGSDKGVASRHLFAPRVKSKDVTIFSRQLASFVKSGVPILRGLSIISEQAENPAFRQILGEIRNEIKEGTSFSATLRKYPKIFPSLYVAMVNSGESSGNLHEVLLRIADHRQKQEAIVNRVRSALAYPALMTLVGGGTIFFMLTFVMPRLMRIFARMEQDLPAPTKFLLSISSALQHGWMWLLLGLIVVIVMVRQGAKTKAQRSFISYLKLHMPILGPFYYKSELAQFSRTLELLINSSIPILKAIKVAVPILNNLVIQDELMKSYKDLEEGSSFGKSMAQSEVFPKFMTSLIIVGEESGRLDEALGEIASTYERDTDEAIKVMTSLLEPILILVMGLIVGFIVVAMLLPIFEINMMAN
ncbi:MAG: type II secretion system F family protein [Candidatus Omnitrophica bacterium]|nr:type II secretion system F family protein [Candidatus Omnitrophota bacterium]